MYFPTLRSKALSIRSELASSRLSSMSGRVVGFSNRFARCNMYMLTMYRSIVGGEYVADPIQGITTERLRKNMNSMFEANFCEQHHLNSYCSTS